MFDWIGKLPEQLQLLIGWGILIVLVLMIAVAAVWRWRWSLSPRQLDKRLFIRELGEGRVCLKIEPGRGQINIGDSCQAIRIKDHGWIRHSIMLGDRVAFRCLRSPKGRRYGDKVATVFYDMAMERVNAAFESASHTLMLPGAAWIAPFPDERRLQIENHTWKLRPCLWTGRGKGLELLCDGQPFVAQSAALDNPALQKLWFTVEVGLWIKNPAGWHSSGGGYMVDYTVLAPGTCYLDSRLVPGSRRVPEDGGEAIVEPEHYECRLLHCGDTVLPWQVGGQLEELHRVVREHISRQAQLTS